MNEAGDMFEEGRIEACVRAHLDEPPAEMIDRVLEAVRHFSEGTPQHDDLTLVVLRYFGSAA
jgi:serine phosphatase RsbU (regulator of sigma subunit)